MEVMIDMEMTRWFRLPENVVDELLLTGHASFTVELDGQTEHVVLDIRDTEGVEAVYRGEE